MDSKKSYILIFDGERKFVFFSMDSLSQYCDENGITKFSVEVLDIPILEVPNV